MSADLVRIPAGRIALEGMLELPDHGSDMAAQAVVLFAHGSGSGRLSPRNNQVARSLRERRLGTLLIDLLTPEEDSDHALRFDIPLLSERLGYALRFLTRDARTRALAVGLFGASTGAAAAQPKAVGAVVSRGGRPDLAGDAALARVQAPTLLIVGGRDSGVIELNEQALAMLRCAKQLAIVPRATHLFEEPGTLDVVARLAADWFASHLQHGAGGAGQQSMHRTHPS